MPSVKVDLKKCDGDSVCVGVCPTNVFEMQELKDHPNGQKAVVVRESECILCMACVTQCPTEAITVTE